MITICGSDAVRAMMEGCKPNKEVYARMAGYERSADQRFEEDNTLKFEYHKIKDVHEQFRGLPCMIPGNAFGWSCNGFDKAVQTGSRRL